jgi:hypothetical protein
MTQPTTLFSLVREPLFLSQRTSSSSLRQKFLSFSRSIFPFRLLHMLPLEVSKYKSRSPARYLSLVILLTCAFAELQAQENVELFGYFESQMMGMVLKKDFDQLYTNKLRVDLKSSLSDRVTFAGNFVYKTYHGKKNWNIMDFMSADVRSQVPAAMQSFYVIPFSDEQYLDNAYLKFAFKHFDLTAGKQQISLGTGYVWNPVDVFNIKDILDPTYEQPGHNAIRLDVPLGPSYTLTGLYSPESSWENSAKLVQLKGRISRFDYALIAIEKDWLFHDYFDFNMVKMNFTESHEKRRLLGMSTAGELLGLGIWAEYGYNRMEETSDFYELVVGGDYTFDFQTYLMVEFYRNTLGKGEYRDYDLNDWMRMFAAEQKSITRDQIYLFVQHPATDFLELGLSTVYSLSDGSLALVPTLTYSFAQNVDMMAYLNYNVGEEGKVFGKNTGNGGLLRARVYF